MSVVVAGLLHESNTFCPRPTELTDFRVCRGERVREQYIVAHHELGGMLAGAAALGVPVRPLVAGYAIPSGVVTREAYERLVGELVDGIGTARPEGVLLALHGAMVSEDFADADGQTIRRVREAIGADCPLIVTLDFHANVSPLMVEQSDALIIYRTYPHLDQRARGEEAAALMARVLNGGARPRQALCAPPLILNLKAQETGREPMQWVMALLERVAGREGVLSASVAGGFPYADVPEMGSAAVVVADGDAELAQAFADELGDAIWKAGLEAALDLPDGAEAVRRAREDGPTPTVLLDYGDNVGGGSSADGTLLLRELIEQGAEDWVVTMWAPDAVERCRAAGAGAELALEVGGTVDDGQGPPVAIEGRVRGLFDGTYEEPQPRHGGNRFLDQGPTAVVELPRRGHVVLTTRRPSPNSLHQLKSVGIQPERKRIVVAKGAIAPKAAYEPIAGRMLEVDTPGFTSADPLRFTYHHRRRPMAPFEDVTAG